MQVFHHELGRCKETGLYCFYITPLLHRLASNPEQSVVEQTFFLKTSTLRGIMERLGKLGFVLETLFLDKVEGGFERRQLRVTSLFGSEKTRVTYWMNDFTIKYCLELGYILYLVIRSEFQGQCVYQTSQYDENLLSAILTKLQTMILFVERKGGEIFLRWW